MVLKSQTTSFAKADGTLGPGATYAYSYDSWGNITCIKDPSGTETVMAYANTDSNKNLSTHNSLYQNAQYTTGAGWNQMVTKATLVKDEVHGTTQLKQTHYKYDSAGNLLQEDEVCGDGYRTTKYTYDSYGNMLTKTDANGNQLCFEYADTTEKPYKSAFLTRVYKPDNTTIATYDYDFDLGVKTMVTDPKGNIYRYKYDAIGRLTEEYLDTNDTKIGITRLLDYDDKNSTVTLKYGNDSSNFQLGRIKYDPLFGKAIELLRCSNLVTRDWVELMTEDWRTQKQFEYNSEGLVASETDGDGDSTSYIYDELGRKTVVNLPDGSTTRFEYDDRKLTTIDGKGNKQERLYDLLDRLVEVAEYPNPNEVCTTKYYYDTYYENSGDKPKYHLVKVVNPKNAATINTYDNLGRLVRTDYPQDGLSPMAAEVFTYDNVGNLKTKTNGKGTRTLDYEYFAGYRLKTITEADGRKISYTYDNNDNPLTQTTNGVTYTYTYDPRNRVTDFTARLDGNSFLLKYDYDAFGRVTSITYPGRTSPVTYTYDELDRLEMIPGFVDYCGYNGDNALEDMGLSNGIVNKYFYDHNNRPEDFRIKGQGRLLNLRYKYDEAGNIASLNDDCFEYDGMNRLIWSGNVPKAALSSKNFGNGMAWGCDGAGNITRKEIYQNSQLKENVTLGYDLANRLLKMGSTTYNNSDAGERLSKSGNSETWNYTYDGESRLLKVTKNSSTLTESFYDGVGMRYKKVSNGKTKYYIYSGSNPLVEYTPADGKYTYYIYAGQRSVAEEKDGKKIFYHRDHLGSTRALTDEDRKLVGLCKYDAWGNLESINAYDDYLINGDMENHDQYASERWQGFGDNCGESCFFATGDGIDGSDAIKLKRSSGETSTGWTMKDIFASPNTDYVLNGYFRSEDSNSTKAKAQMLYYDSNGVLIATHETVALGYSGTGWKEFTLNSHAPTNAASLEIRLTFDSGAGMTCYFDNVSLKVPGLQGKYDYTGKKEDEGTGLKYFGARFYDPEVGRFITVDPGKDGLNWYAYSDNNPINKFDPDGYSAKSATRSIWEIGIKSYLEKNGYNVTADLMRHSLQDNPSNLRYGQNSSIAQKIQDSKEWKDAVAGYISAFGGDLKQSHFKVEDSLRFKSGDLHLALNKVGYTIEGTKVGDKWNISVTMKDTFDFTTWNAQKSDFIANTANNLAYIDQKSGVINPYDIEVTFTQEVSTSDDSDSDDDSCYGGW
jgi:RHS repeat-associated protein